MKFHDLRHTAATLLLGQGVHSKVVANLLGHATVAMTLDRYSHRAMARHQEAADAMEAVLGDPESSRVGSLVGSSTAGKGVT
ncbi:integrase family protein [mine drainage metagenome]|uniref:Integrase family protein n=1 Tax=mine drainage metagenome TaxID=410659 RepID=T0ZDL9_9ZZZZ